MDNKDIEIVKGNNGYSIYYRDEYMGYIEGTVSGKWLYSSGMAIQRGFYTKEGCIEELIAHIKRYNSLKYWHTDTKAKQFVHKIDKAIQFWSFKSEIFIGIKAKLLESGITVNEYKRIMEFLRVNHL